MIRDIDNDSQQIEKSLSKDSIGRNAQMSRFMGLLNSVQKNTVISLDGAWGSGKTYFVRQLEYLNVNEKNEFPNLDSSVVKKFREKYVVIYYNAWKNDHHSDPLQSILAYLINDLWTLHERTGDKFVQFSNALLKSATKVLTVGVYDAKAIEETKSVQSLVKAINTEDDRKQAIDDILANYIQLKGKKILFIIDELDRCKPDFAVRLLETIKHFYDSDDLVFLLSTDNKQLSYTIRKVYGQDFNGIGYLNKFYDLVFHLPSIDRHKYVQYLGEGTNGSVWKYAAPLEVANYLNMSMREINRYYSSMSLIKGYMDSEGGFESSEEQIVKYILIPYAYGLRIKDLILYEQFVSGVSGNDLSRYYQDSEYVSDLARRLARNQDKDPKEELMKVYDSIKKTPPHSSRDYHLSRAVQIFKDVVILMNSVGQIDESDSDDDKTD